MSTMNMPSPTISLATDATASAPTSHAAPALAARAISVEIDGSHLLNSVDFEAHRGELHALLGPNGAGKSTLLGALAGDVKISAGTVTIEGRELSTWKLRELAKARAVLLQQHEVFFPFSVREVVEMGRAPWRGTPLEDDDERMIANAMEQTDIVALADRTVPSLSGGERARAALARVLAQGAPTLMLDEPTAALDLKHQEDVLRLARERAASGDTVIVVLHDLNLAAAYADRVTLMQRGRVVASGAPREVLTADRISAVYGQPVEVFDHPRTGIPLILPLR